MKVALFGAVLAALIVTPLFLPNAFAATVTNTKLYGKALVEFTDGTTETLQESSSLTYTFDVFRNDAQLKPIKKITFIWEVRSTNPNFAITSNGGFLTDIKVNTRVGWDTNFMNTFGDRTVQQRTEGAENVWQIYSISLTNTQLATRFKQLFNGDGVSGAPGYYNMALRAGGSLAGTLEGANKVFAVDSDEYLLFTTYFDGEIPSGGGDPFPEPDPDPLPGGDDICIGGCEDEFIALTGVGMIAFAAIVGVMYLGRKKIQKIVK